MKFIRQFDDYCDRHGSEIVNVDCIVSVELTSSPSFPCIAINLITGKATKWLYVTRESASRDFDRILEALISSQNNQTESPQP